jgi:hypothetical protein
LRENIANELYEEYSRSPLLFPVKIVTWSDFSSFLVGSGSISASAAHRFENVSAVYIVFKTNNLASTQCFPNPFIEYQVNINGVLYPRRPYRTVSDLRQKNQTNDTFDINNSRITSIPEDLRTSLQPFTVYMEYKYTAAEGQTAEKHEVIRNFNWTTGDMSNFMIGIPLCDSGMFQSGITTAVKASIQGSRLPDTNNSFDEVEHAVPKKLKNIGYEQPVIITVSDNIAIFRTSPGGDGFRVKTVADTYDQIMGAM